MSRRWQWDFEDEPRPPRQPDPPPPPPPPLPALTEAPGSQRARIRRRRGGALIGLGVVAALIFALSGSGGKRHAAGATQARGHARTGAALGGGPTGESGAGGERAGAAALGHPPVRRARRPRGR